MFIYQQLIMEKQENIFEALGNIMKPEPIKNNWVIIDLETGKYFSLLGSAHFTDNREIAQRFSNEMDTIGAQEEYLLYTAPLTGYPTRVIFRKVLNELVTI